MSMYLEIFGVPASGKTTVASRLKEDCGIRLVESGASCIRYIVSGEFISFFRFSMKLNSGRRGAGKMLKNRLYLLYAYLTIMKNRNSSGIRYSFSGIIEQIGSSSWGSKHNEEIAREFAQHVKRYWDDAVFLYCRVGDAEAVYRRMMAREGKVLLCYEPQEKAIETIRGLIDLFDRISEKVGANVVDTGISVNETFRQLPEIWENGTKQWSTVWKKN